MGSGEEERGWVWRLSSSLGQTNFGSSWKRVPAVVWLPDKTDDRARKEREV